MKESSRRSTNHNQSFTAKKSVLISTSLVALLPVGTSAAAETATILGNRVNVRLAASLDGDPIGVLRKGESVNVVNRFNTAASDQKPSRWAEIELPKAIPLYVHSSFIENGVVKAKNLNIRLGPDENYAVIGRLKSGDKVQVVSQKLKWVQIICTNQARAYVAADYLSTTTPKAIANTSLTDGRAGAAAPPKPCPPCQNTVTTDCANPIKPKPVIPNSAGVAIVQSKPVTQIAVSATQLPAAMILTSSSKAAIATPMPTPVQTPVSNSLPVLITHPPAKTAIPVQNCVSQTSTPTAEGTEKSADTTPKLVLASGEPLLNRIGVSYRRQMNVEARFKGQVAGAGSPLPPGVYENGYVLPSSRQEGTDDGYTWNWGYQNADQIHGDELWLDRTSVSTTSVPVSKTDDNKDPDGVEISYSRVVLKAGKSQENLFGFECALNYSKLDFKNSSAASVSLIRTTDRYALQGIIPPGAPYSGTFSGPGPLIFDTPAGSGTTLIADGASLTSSREFSANVYGLRLGPTYDRAFSRLRAGISGGLALAGVDSEFKYQDTVSGPLSLSSSGKSSQFDLLPGWYVAGNINFALTPHIGLFYSLQFQNMSDLNNSVNGREVTIDQENALFHAIGVSYSF